MHTKDLALVLVIIFALALIADDSGSIKGKFSDIGERSSVTNAVSNIEEFDTAEEALRAAETAEKSGDTHFNEATKALENLDWDECISSCLVARDYLKISKKRFDEGIEELETKKEESKNKVLGAFIDQSVNYYSCLVNIAETKIEACNSMELTCLAYSHEEDEEGNEHKAIVDTYLETLEDTESQCEDLLAGINSNEDEEQDEEPADKEDNTTAEEQPNNSTE